MPPEKPAASECSLESRCELSFEIARIGNTSRSVRASRDVELVGHVPSDQCQTRPLGETNAYFRIQRGVGRQTASIGSLAPSSPDVTDRCRNGYRTNLL